MLNITTWPRLLVSRTGKESRGKRLGIHAPFAVWRT